MIGAGFIGTGILELWHIIVSTTLLPVSFSSTLSSISPWSFFTSRLFLAVLIVLSLVAGWRQRRSENGGQLRPGLVFLYVGLFTIGAFVFMGVVKLPPAYYNEFFFSRPGELVPGFFFGVATVGYLVRGRWRDDVFEHWLVLGLLISTIAQILFMAQSHRLYGPLFFTGHGLKALSLVAVLVGLLSNVFMVFRRVDESSRIIQESNAELEEKTTALTAFTGTLQELQRITMESYSSYDSLYEDYLHTGCDVLGLETGIISQVDGPTYTIRAARSPFGWKPGDVFPLEDLFCAAVIRKEGPVSIDEIGKEEGWSAHQTYRDTGLESYIGAPIYKNRAVAGTLCFSSSEIRAGGFKSYEEDLVTAMAQTVGRLMEREQAEDERHEVERMKDEFLSVVSHELRTPLTSIRGALGLLAGGVFGTLPDKGQRMLEIASSNTDRLVRLINDILDIERIQSGKTTLERGPVVVPDLLTAAVEVMQAMATEARVTLSVEATGATVWADSDRLTQTLTNLISNSIKFSPPGGSVRIASKETDSDILFSVADHGRGIPQDKLDLVFERFQQVDSSDAREKGGTGLGLPICREIVQAHGGRIWVESTLGEGSTFWFTIPRTDVAQTVEKAEMSR